MSLYPDKKKRQFSVTKDVVSFYTLIFSLFSLLSSLNCRFQIKDKKEILLCKKLRYKKFINQKIFLSSILSQIYQKCINFN